MTYFFRRPLVEVLIPAWALIQRDCRDVHLVHRDHVVAVFDDGVKQRFVVSRTTDGGVVVPHELPTHKQTVFACELYDISGISSITSHCVFRTSRLIGERALARLDDLKADNARVLINKTANRLNRHGILPVAVISLNLESDRKVGFLGVGEKNLVPLEVTRPYRLDL